MTAIQDLLPHNHCYGCGADNDKGMQIKSHWHGDECVCTYTPKPEQCAGPDVWLSAEMGLLPSDAGRSSSLESARMPKRASTKGMSSG